MSKRFSIEVDSLMHEKILDYNKKNGISRVQVVQQALEFFFEKQDEKEILNAVLQRLDAINTSIINIEVHANRTNLFLNRSAEHFMNSEEYSKIRRIVKEDLTEQFKFEGDF